jgi:hypothetical protein
MPNQRAKDQQLLPFAAKRQFVDEFDAGLVQIGCSNRSQFIRDAICEKLARENIHIPKQLASAPGRTVNSKTASAKSANSIVDSAAKRLLKKASAAVLKSDQK